MDTARPVQGLRVDRHVTSCAPGSSVQEREPDERPFSSTSSRMRPGPHQSTRTKEAARLARGARAGCREPRRHGPLETTSNQSARGRVLVSKPTSTRGRVPTSRSCGGMEYSLSNGHGAQWGVQAPRAPHCQDAARTRSGYPNPGRGRGRATEACVTLGLPWAPPAARSAEAASRPARTATSPRRHGRRGSRA